MAVTFKFSGSAPDCGAMQSGVASPTPSPIDPAGALSSASSALQHLLKSNGYKNARQQNKSDAVFYGTEIGLCEVDLRAAIKKLGG